MKVRSYFLLFQFVAELQGKLSELKRQVAEIRQRRASQEQSEYNITDPEQKVKTMNYRMMLSVDRKC